jgi:spermidine synthase
MSRDASCRPRAFPHWIGHYISITLDAWRQNITIGDGGVFVFQFLLAFTVLVSSACGLIIEIVAGRLIAPIFGMSLYTWTSIIAVVLAGLSVGHWFGGRMTLGMASQPRQSMKIAYALFLSSASSLLILLLLDIVPGFVRSAQMDVITAILTVSMGLFFLPSLFVGIVSPLATKLAIDLADNSETGVVIGRMYALGAVGAIFGALLAGYFMIAVLGSRLTVFLVAGVYFAFGCVFMLMRGHGGSKLLLLAALLGAGLVSGVHMSGGLKSRCYAESNYFCIQVQDIRQFGGSARLMALDHLVHSINDREQPELLHSPYVHFVDEYTERRFGRTPISVFFIGGGGFSLPRAWIAKYQGKAELTIAEIDPVATRVARDMLWFDERGSNTKIIHDDARLALNAMKEAQKFDLIFGDAFHDVSIPAHLVTREFNALIASRLAEQGVYVVNVVDNAMQPRFLLSFVKTLSQTFPEIEIWFEPDPNQESARMTFVVVAAKSTIDDDILFAERGFERSWWRWPENRLKKVFASDRVPILTDDLAPVEHLMSGTVLDGLS